MTANPFFRRTACILCFLVCMCLPCSSNPQGDFTENWWENNTLIAKGHGFPPKKAASPDQARILARRAAIVDGYRRLAEKAKSIRITAEKTLGVQIDKDSVTKEKINALIHDAKVLSIEFDNKGVCTVILSVPLYGVKDSIANVALSPVDKENFPLPTNNNAAQGNYTGLIIDCGDADLNPVLLPTIRNENNQAVYAYNNLDYDKIISNGMIGYVKKDSRVGGNFFSVCAAKDISRAGSNPLVIKATALSDDNTCPVVSTSDADKILAENQLSHFLDEGAVVFTGYRVGGVRA